jgi:hypothetical protein
VIVNIICPSNNIYTLLLDILIEFHMVKIKSNNLKPDKIVMLTLAFIIMTMAMIPGYNITRNFSESVYAQSSGTDTGNSNTEGNLAETNNTTNVNVTETNIPDTENIVPNQYIVVLKENATFNPQVANDTVSSLSDEWSNLGLNVTSFPEVGMLTIDLNQTIAQEGEAGTASVADILDEIQSNSNVDYIESNQIFGIE